MGRPFVHLNCAASLDGRIAAPDGSPMVLSDDVDWRRVHALRAWCDAILVGVGTVLSDDPSLRIKRDIHPSPAPDPLRVVLDPRGRTPSEARVVDRSAPSLLVHGPGVASAWPDSDAAQAPVAADGHLLLPGVLDLLAERGVRRLLVEGGGHVLQSFVREGLCDVWTIYQAPVVVGGDGPQIWPGRPSGQGRRVHVEAVERQGKGVLWTLRP